MIAAYQRISRADGDLGKDGKDKSTVFLARILAVKYSICLPILKGEQR